MSRPWNTKITAPFALQPKYEGQFNTFEDWVNHASKALAPREFSFGGFGKGGEDFGGVRAVCIDSKGRRCSCGKDFMIAHEENAFPVYYFWEFEVIEMVEIHPTQVTMKGDRS